MKTIFSFIILLFFVSNSYAQKHKFLLYTKGVGISIFVNGEFFFKTVNKKTTVKYNFKSPKDSCVIKLSKSGMEDEFFTYSSKPIVDVTKLFWAMQMERYRLDTLSDLSFDFTKLKYDIPNNPIIGTIPGTYGMPIHWNDLVKNESDLSQINKVIQKELEISGFNNTFEIDSTGNMFEEKKQVKRNANILIGAVVKEFHLKGYNPVMRSKNLTVRMKIDWQFYNNNTGEFLTSIITNKESFMVDFTANLSEGVNLSFGENFAEVLRSPEVLSILLKVDPEANVSYKEDVLKEYSFSKNDAPTFDSYGGMIKAVNPSVITIKGDKGHGSGFVISDEGYVITNYHVVHKNHNMTVTFQNGMELPFELLNYSEEYDVALLKIVGKGYQPLKMSESNSELGDDVIAIGTPGFSDLTNSISKGIVSGFRKTEDGQSFIQTDVSVSPGNSGGPLINNKGEVIGIVAKKIVDFGVEGIAFAIPIQDALEVLKINFK